MQLRCENRELLLIDRLNSIEGTFYHIGEDSVEYFGFYIDKTVLRAVVKCVVPVHTLPEFFDKGSTRVHSFTHRRIVSIGNR